MAIKVTKVRAVTLPLFKMMNNREYIFRFVGPMFIGKEVQAKEGKKMEPPHLAHVTDLNTGEDGQIILGAVLVKELQENYPGDTYVGKSFEIVKHAPDGPKRYSLWTITEVAVTLEDDPAPKDEAPAYAGSRGPQTFAHGHEEHEESDLDDPTDNRQEGMGQVHAASAPHPEPAPAPTSRKRGGR